MNCLIVYRSAAILTHPEGQLLSDARPVLSLFVVP